MKITMKYKINFAKIQHLRLIWISIFALGIAINTFAQVTVKAKNVPIRQILKTIEKNTEYRFFYNDDFAALDKVASLNVNNVSIDNALTTLFSASGISWEKKDKSQIVLVPSKITDTKAQPADGQTHKVTGLVTDANDGSPLIGVAVVVKGTTNGTSTDINGRYHLNASPGSTIVFTYIGMKKQEVIIKNEIVNARLESDSKLLDEVVSIGYGTQKKVTVTGAVVSVKGDDIKAAPTTSVTNALVGRLPGLIALNTSGEPGYDASTLLIRGKSTTGDNSPLIVVDGVADREGGFNNIDPNDIESVNILKDASAAIYGSRAANGVILVTTKRGKEGKAVINYTFNYGLKQPTVLPKMCSSAEYAQLVNEIETSVYGRSAKYSDAQIQKFKDGSDPTNYPNTNWLKQTLNTFCPQIQQNISISGGNDKIKYFTSIGHQYTDNYYKNSASNYKQYNLRTNLDVQLTSNFKASANISITDENRNAPYLGSENIWRYLVKGDPTVNITWPANGLPVLASQDNFNPVTATSDAMGYQKNKYTVFNTDLALKWDMSFITKGLSADGGVSVDKGNTFNKQFQKQFNLYGLDSQTGSYYSKAYGPSTATLGESMNRVQSITANAKIRYERTFNNVHNINAFVAYEQNQYNYDYLYGYRQDYTSTAIDQLFAGDKKTMTNDGTSNETVRQNYFGRVDYSYAEKYLVQFNWRYDGSQNFPKNHRFGFFPGVSLGWRASEESFWKQNLSFINYFKVRGSVGKMGNDKIGEQYAYLTMYSFGDNATLGGSNPLSYSGIYQTVTANPNIRWEEAKTYNVGFDSKFMNNAFNFEFDIFKNRRTGILRTRSASLPDYTGLALPPENIGICESKGFEASLGYTKTLGEFRFNIGGNISYAKSKVIYTDEATGTLSWQKEEGKPIGSYGLMYDAIGIYRTQADLDKYPHLSNVKLGDLIFRDVNNDGVIDGKDQIRTTKTNTPEFTYGITFNTTYRQWDLSMLWQGAANVWQYSFWESGEIGNFTKDYYDNRWTADNINSKYPRVYDRSATEVGYYNTFWLKSGSYIRLKNIQLSYTLPKSIVQKLSISGLRLYLSGSNLLTFTGLKNLDPETLAGSQNFAGWSTPQSKVYNIGINVSF